MRRLLLIALLLVCLLPAPTLAACSGYTVKAGDTLTRIAKANDTTYLELAKLNNIASPYRIFVGQCLRLPSTPAPVPAPTPAASSDAKGLAMATNHPEDLAALGVKWFYNWGDGCSSPCIPMVRAMQLPRNCAEIIIVGNEPNAVEPYGAPVSPVDAVARVKAIEAQCPQSRLVVGNVSADNWGSGSGATWLSAFLKAYPGFHQVLGAHCYTQNLASYCTGQLAAMRRLYAGEMWVTEFGVLSGDAAQFKTLLDYIATNFTRYAAYTNSQPGSCGGDRQGWELSSKVDLVGCDGQLTPLGVIYANQK